MKILIVSEMSVPHTSGGGETRYVLLARELSRLGHDVTWLSMRQRACPDEETIDGVRHLHRGPRISSPPTRPLAAKLRFMASVFLHLLARRYDVVDCQTYAPLPAAWLACALRRQPIVATIHDTAAAGPKAADQWLSSLDALLASRAERLLVRLPYTRVLTVSAAVQADLVGRMGLPGASVSVVPNAIDIDRIEAVPAHPLPADLVFIGRLVPHKHPEVFLRAAAAVSARRQASGQPPLRLKLVGGGPLAAQVAAEVDALGLRGALVHLGEVAQHDEVIAHLKSARLLLLPSTREGFGLVLAEAMAAGTAVLAWRLPAVEETLGEALVDCALEPDEQQALVQAIERVLDDETLRQQRVAIGRARARSHFGAAAFAQGVLEVYRRAIATGAQRHSSR